jgi:hypothetical protein
MLDIPELLDLVLDHIVDKKFLLPCTQVSNAWFHSSIAHLWYELETIDPLLNLLGEVCYDNGYRAEAMTWVGSILIMSLFGSLYP